MTPRTLSREPGRCLHCAVLLAHHPADGCSCGVDDCDQVAEGLVSKSTRMPLVPRCHRHLKAAVVQAERFGYALVLQALPRDRAMI